MCTNLIDSLECYMDDLVDAFEDFVKKSILVLSVAVGTIILMFMYVLKVVTDRTGAASGTVATRSSEVQEEISRRRSETNLQSKSYERDVDTRKINSVKNNFILPRGINTPPKSTSCIAVNTEESFSPCSDERVLSDDEIPKCKSYVPRRPVLRNCSSTRLSVPSLPTCLPKYQVSAPRACPKHIIASRTSCCSMCCDDKKR